MAMSMTTVWLQAFFKISSFVFSRGNSYTKNDFVNAIRTRTKCIKFFLGLKQKYRELKKCEHLFCFIFYFFCNIYGAPQMHAGGQYVQYIMATL